LVENVRWEREKENKGKEKYKYSFMECGDIKNQKNEI